MSEPHHEVAPAVLARALGSVLQPGTRSPARSMRKRSKGRMFTDPGGAPVAVMTDRRLVQVNGWIEGGRSEGVPDAALAYGSPKRACSGSPKSSWRMMPAWKPEAQGRRIIPGFGDAHDLRG